MTTRSRRPLALGVAGLTLGFSGLGVGLASASTDTTEPVAVTATSEPTGDAAVPATAVATTLPTTAPPTTPPETEGRQDGDLVRTISVSGTGTATVTPDQAVLQLGARSQRETGSEALAALGENSTALIDSLTGLGIAEEDIQTTGISLYPTTNRQGKITGYEASTNVTVTLNEIDRVGEVVDGVAALVGEDLTLNGISFTVSDTDAAMEEARTDAINEARAHADQYAAAAGVTVGAVVTISESGARPYEPIVYREVPMTTSAPAAEQAISVAAGESDLYVTVSVVYEIGG